MKADQYGTPTEQARWRMGWMSPSQRKATQAARTEDSRCSNCQHMGTDSFRNGWGGVGARTLCRHPMSLGAPGNNGHVTAENALCKQWKRKVDDWGADVRQRVAARLPHPWEH